MKDDNRGCSACRLLFQQVDVPFRPLQSQALPQGVLVTWRPALSRCERDLGHP